MSFLARVERGALPSLEFGMTGGPLLWFPITRHLLSNTNHRWGLLSGSSRRADEPSDPVGASPVGEEQG